MDAVDREWMVVSSAADYHPMAKLLLQNPHLAKRKVRPLSHSESQCGQNRVLPFFVRIGRIE